METEVIKIITELTPGSVFTFSILLILFIVYRCAPGINSFLKRQEKEVDLKVEEIKAESEPVTMAIKALVLVTETLQTLQVAFSKQTEANEAIVTLLKSDAEQTQIRISNLDKARIVEHEIQHKEHTVMQETLDSLRTELLNRLDDLRQVVVTANKNDLDEIKQQLGEVTKKVDKFVPVEIKDETTTPAV